MLAVGEQRPCPCWANRSKTECSGGALALKLHQLISLRLAQMLVKLLEPRDHLLLMLVQHGVVDRDGDLVGEGGEETLVLGPVPLLLVRHADHPDHVPAHAERYSEKGPNSGMPRWLANTPRVILDIVGDLRAVFDDHPPEDTGTNRHPLEPLIESRIGRRKPLDRDDVHVDAILVQEVDKPHLRLR